MPQFSKSSQAKLDTCDGRLQRLFNEVIKYQDCSIVCGFRGEEEQNAAYQSGFSHVKWPKGAHNKLPSLAADVCPYPIDFKDEARFIEFGKLVKEVAKRLEIKVEWGGDWADTFGGSKDYPHWQVKP